MRHIRTPAALTICISVMLSLVILFRPFPESVLAAPKGSGSSKSNGSWYENLEVFSEVLSIIRRDYVREVEGKELVEGAIQGMLQKLDPHSGYLDPNFYKDLKVETKGEFGGLGIEITMKDNMLVVVAPMEGSPAEAAGIRAGDRIIKIDGTLTKDFTLVDAVKKLRGPKGESVSLSVHREGMKGLKTVRIVRDNIHVKSVRSRYLGDGIGYVRISQFMETTYADLRKNLDKLSKETGRRGGLRGLILDMRNNPGGLLNQAVQVSDLFLEDGVVVYTDGRMKSQQQKYFAVSQGTEPQYPLVILINEGSASASEIVAGAMKDHGRALVVGKTSFGKGSVQTITPLDNGGALTLTTALYYTKSGKSIQLTGVTPDIEVDAAKEEAEENGDDLTPLTVREGDLPGAIKNPQRGGKSQEKNLSKEGSPEDGSSTMQKLNKTPPAKDDLSSSRVENIDLSVWKKKDTQFAKAWEVVQSYDAFVAK